MLRYSLQVTITSILSVQLLQTPAWACSPQELAVEVNTVTDLMIAQERGQSAEHSDFMKRMHTMMVRTARDPTISYDALCASYEQLIIQLKSPSHRP
jgi:hypothetical protein